MPDFRSKNHDEIQKAFREHERDVWIRNFRYACILAAIFVLAGYSLDILVYANHPEQTKWFLGYRVICSVLCMVFWWVIRTPTGMKNYRLLGLTLPLLPSVCDGVMIYQSDGANSP